MDETHINEGKGNLSCPICNGAMTEQKTTFTFYDVITIDALHHVCENGHTTETEEDYDRISKELKERERRLILSYIGRLLLFSIAGGALFLFGSWAVLSLVTTYAPKSLANHSIGLAISIGLILVVCLCLLLPRIFKTFIAYYWAKQKSKETIKAEEPPYDPEDPLGALEGL